jgi:hypothetical protein
MEGVCGGFNFPVRANLPKCRGFEAKRLKGFEPSTFCMASRRSSQLSYSRVEGDSSLVARFPASALKRQRDRGIASRAVSLPVPAIQAPDQTQLRYGRNIVVGHNAVGQIMRELGLKGASNQEAAKGRLSPAHHGSADPPPDGDA